MRVDQQRLNTHTLFLACTRPALKMGVPMIAWMINVAISFLFFIIMKNMSWLLIFIPIHTLFRFIVRKDVNQFNILYLWLQTKARGLNKKFWGGTSISPLVVKRKKLTKEELISVFSKK